MVFVTVVPGLLDMRFLNNCGPGCVECRLFVQFLTNFTLLWKIQKTF